MSTEVGEENKEGGYDEEMEIRLLIDNNQVGGIIGKAGANVKRVREESGIFLSILKAEYRTVQERILVLKGSISQITKALEDIAELMIQAAERTSNNPPETIAMRLLVQRFIVGAIIGKGGASIKHTQQESDVRIQISNEPLPGSTEKTVTVTGTPTNIHQATTRILTQLKDNPCRPGTKVIPYVPGAPNFYQQPQHHQMPQFGGGGYGQTMMGGGGMPMYGGGYGGHGGQQTTHQPTSTQKIAIPTVCAGCIIGKNGSVVRDLRTRSGCTISIADPEQSNLNERVVTLTGTGQGIQTAINLIRYLVERYQPQQDE